MSRAAHAKRRIVLVDDDAMVRETVKLSLEHAGFLVNAVEDSKKALPTIKILKPDLAILDLYMPDIDGRQIIRHLKSDPETREMPVVVFSSSNEPIDVVTGLESGAVEYIAKPIDGELLVNKIRQILKLS